MTQLLRNDVYGISPQQPHDTHRRSIGGWMSALAVLVALAIQPQTALGSDVQGVISDAATGLPLPGATVILWETHDTVITDANGEYFFAAAPAGATLVIGKDGYAAGVGAAVSCNCPYQGDYDADGFLTALDLGHMIDVLFAGKIDIQDPACPTPRMDFDNDGFETALDLGKLIDYLFAGALPPPDPCAAL